MLRILLLISILDTLHLILSLQVTLLKEGEQRHDYWRANNLFKIPAYFLEAH